jgi:hypothetical protein
MGYRRCVTYTQADETGASLPRRWMDQGQRPARPRQLGAFNLG